MVAQAQADPALQRLEQAYNIDEPLLDEQRSGFFTSYALFPFIAISAIAFVAWELLG